jgi:hypothetical protein
MSNKKISQFEMLLTLSGLEQAALSYAGSNYRVTLNSIAALATKQSVGLGNVDNTSDLNKPLSQATISALGLKANIGHSHVLAMTEVTDLIPTLAEKSIVGHTHVLSEIGGLVASLANKSDINHTHLFGISNIINLQTVLDSKAALEHYHDQYAYSEHAHSNYSEIGHTHSEYALSNHSHTVTIPDVVALQAVLANKSDIDHTHSNYAPVSHTHVMADISDYAPSVFSNDSCEVVHLEDITRDLTPADAGKLLRFESAGAKELNILSEWAFTQGKLFHVTNRSTYGDLTLRVIANDITLNPPKGGLLILEPGDTVSLHYVGFNTFDVYGSTKSALGY